MPLGIAAERSGLTKYSLAFKEVEVSTKKKRTLTPEQAAAVAEYRDWFGREWKSQLRIDWWRGGSPYKGYYGQLHRMRISHGLGWLYSYEG